VVSVWKENVKLSLLLLYYLAYIGGVCFIIYYVITAYQMLSDIHERCGR